MKVGILTFPNSVSYGAVMQMYALYRTVENMGHDVEVINYHNAYMKAEKHILKNRNESYKFSIKKKLRKAVHHRSYSSFLSFEKKRLNKYPRKPFSDKEKLKELGKRYDAVICGSDQVWNPNITDNDISYFLDFCNGNTKRISYAPSFGVEHLTEELCTSIRGELEKFHAVSAREEVGAKLVKGLVDKDVSVVLDPTLLVDRSEWQELEQKHTAADGEYILYYTVKHSDSLYRKCLEFSKKTSIKVIVVGGNLIKRLKNKNPLLEYAIDVKPEEWLYLVHNARYVVTNSFHGTAFSIIYRKDFFVEYPPITNSRLVQIITDLGLEFCVVHEDQSLVAEPVSYEETEVRLAEAKESSMNFLRKALQ